VTLNRFQGHGVIVMPIDALSVLCAQLTRDLLAIAKFLFLLVNKKLISICKQVAEKYEKYTLLF